MKRIHTSGVLALAALLALGAGAAAQSVTFTDPTGDDKGPGGYVYPTDTVYTPGSFDLVKLEVEQKGNKVDFAVTMGAALADPWGMKVGFATQMVFVFIDTDHTEGSGSTKGLPGLNVEFAAADAWDRVVILSPQTASRVNTEVETKAAAMKDSIVVPSRTKGSNRTISASVDRAALPEGDLTKWGYQVVVQSNEGFPAATDLLTRKVNEYEGQHRFGGGSDDDCDPHAIDILAGAGKGDAAEAQAQYDMLKHDCAAKQGAVLTMVRNP